MVTLFFYTLREKKGHRNKRETVGTVKAAAVPSALADKLADEAKTMNEK